MMTTIKLNIISKYRQAFMGLAIFWIFFYHTGVDIPVLRELFAMGWMGVDIFFFVSGYGLCASLSRNRSIKSFFKRRFFRIIPTWWIILTLMAIVGTIASLKGYPNSTDDYFYWYTGLGWWTGNCNFEWYIPTLIVFYLAAPLLGRQKLGNLVIITIISIILAIVFGYFRLFQHIYISYSRIPIYVSGFLVYKYQTRNSMVKTSIWLPLCILGLIWFSLGLYIKLHDVTFGLTIARVAIPLFIVPMLCIIGFIISKLKPIETALSFLGLISLEVYLLHINHEFSEFVKNTLLVGVHDYLIKMTWFAIVLGAGLVLHLIIEELIKYSRAK